MALKEVTAILEKLRAEMMALKSRFRSNLHHTEKI